MHSQLQRESDATAAPRPITTDLSASGRNTCGKAYSNEVKDSDDADGRPSGVKIWRWRIVFNPNIYPQARNPTGWVYMLKEPKVGDSLVAPPYGVKYEIEEFERRSIRTIKYDDSRPDPAEGTRSGHGNSNGSVQ